MIHEVSSFRTERKNQSNKYKHERHPESKIYKEYIYIL